MSSKDIQQVIGDWPYDPDQIAVRKIVGQDGRTKLQMRLDLGILQMEPDGRPDGKRPHGFESLLEYHKWRLDRYRREQGSAEGFELTQAECRELRDEAAMYYRRYLSLFVLEEFVAVERDTRRNLQVLDLCNRFAEDQQDRFALEAYRPYIIMMNTRARALSALEENDLDQALTWVRDGLRRIRRFFRRHDRLDLFDASDEVSVLKQLRRNIAKRLPVDPMVKLRRKLQRALDQERYEEAAVIRDELRRIAGRA